MHTSRRQISQSLPLAALAAWFLPKQGQAQESPEEDPVQIRVPESDLEEVLDLLEFWFQHRWSSDQEYQDAWWRSRWCLGGTEP